MVILEPIDQIFQNRIGFRQTAYDVETGLKLIPPGISGRPDDKLKCGIVVFEGSPERFQDLSGGDVCFHYVFLLLSRAVR